MSARPAVTAREEAWAPGEPIRSDPLRVYSVFGRVLTIKIKIRKRILKKKNHRYPPGNNNKNKKKIKKLDMPKIIRPTFRILIHPRGVMTRVIMRT